MDGGKLRPTDEQAAIVTAARSAQRLCIQAGAGTGKTSTLNLVAEDMRGKSALYLAYNGTIATEARASFPSHVQCRTIHSLAHEAVGYQYRHRLNGGRQTSRQVAKILDTRWVNLRRDVSVTPAQVARIAVETVKWFCYSADEEIRFKHVPQQNGIAGEAHKELVSSVLPYARKVWADLLNTKGVIRFEHDHYLKMWALRRPLLAADVVMLDEAQDSNPVVTQLVQDQSQSQLIAVGDSCQSMYGWRGAVDALSGWDADVELFLSQSWRFGQPVADEANKWLSQIDTPMRLKGNPNKQSILAALETPNAVLCRTNAEAMRQVMSMLDEGRKVSLVGKGSSIRALAEAAAELKAGRRTGHSELYVFATWAALQDYAENDAAGRDLKPFVDLIDAHGTDEIIAAIDALVPEDQAQTVVSTVHTAKGREWDSVQIAGDFAEPKPDEDGAQGIAKADAMLGYVAVTRARVVLDRGGMEWIDKFITTPGTGVGRLLAG
ncbi:UvrD-helicase domain-containing protein [Mycobacteroides abscessus]|uniref:UvrD-helicase domain-containing protein n=1 Tax=Mycobacteroides abscessus TaxID=36809 RepID=UPI001EED826E|nr:UvrD-helicase domain-containing protein [Mycobacteroides abscessus]